MSGSLQRIAAALLAVLFFASPMLSAAAALPPPAAGGPDEPGAMRTPDFAALDAAPDKTAQAPAARPRALAVTAANWTVLVYMVADNDLEAYAIEDLNEMEAAPASTAVNVIVEVDRSARYDTSNGDWSTTRRYAVAHDNDASAIGSTLLSDLGELNMGDPQTLVDFLAWGVDAYPAQHYLVVLWDHGFGWSAGFGNDLGDGDHLTLAEMDQAMRLAAEHLGRPFDIVGFDACIMQQVEVIYEMAWTADFFVGAENLEPVTGWPYDQMLGPAIDNPSIAPRALSAAMSQAYMAFYGVQRDEMMSAVDARALRTTLSAAMNRMAGELSAVVEDPNTMGQLSPERAIVAARDQAPAMFNVDYVDLGDFARRIEEDTRIPPAAQDAARDVRASLNLSIFAEAHTVYRPNITGLSVYLPSSSVPLRYTSTRWANDSFWDEWLVAYLSGATTQALEPSVSVASPGEGQSVSRHFYGEFSGTSASGAPLRLEYKAAWGNWTPAAQAGGNLTFSGALDAGPLQFPLVLSFRSVDDAHHPSPSVERNVAVVADPVSVAPALAEMALAVGRTTVVPAVATLRAPFTGFTVQWRQLPAGVTNAGTTSFSAPGPAPVAPFNVSLSLQASGSTAEGTTAVELVFEAVGSPGVQTVLWVNLNVTRPLADAYVAPLLADNPTPLPSDVVQVTTNVSNIGFDNLGGERIIARLTGPNSSELLNLSWGPLVPGEAVPISFNFTATYGLQVVTVTADPEPAQEELTATNNLRALAFNISRYLVEVEGPGSRVDGGPAATTTPVPITIYNRGTDPDTYNVSAGSLSDAAWLVDVPAANLSLAARSFGSLILNVTSPAAAEGGSALTFTLEARSQSDGSVFSTVVVTVEILEVFNATVTLSQDDVTIPYRGTTSVVATVENRGNGHETFALTVQQGDAKLGATSNTSSMSLAPGVQATANLTLRDLGLLSTERPYSLEFVATSAASGARFSGLLSVRVEPHTEVTARPIERSIVLSLDHPTSFYVNVTNLGNTNAVVALTAATSEPLIVATLSVPGALLLPGDTLVVNGTANLTGLPLAGAYNISVRALETRTNITDVANLTVAVPVVHDIAAVLGPGVTPPTTARGQSVTITIQNRGNIVEIIDIILGFIRVDVRVRIVPATGRVSIPPFSNTTVELFLEPTSDAAYSGAVPVEISRFPGAAVVHVTVPYSFAADESGAPIVWLVLTAGGALAFGGWLLVRRAAARQQGAASKGPETPPRPPPPP